MYGTKRARFMMFYDEKSIGMKLAHRDRLFRLGTHHSEDLVNRGLSDYRFASAVVDHRTVF